MSRVGPAVEHPVSRPESHWVPADDDHLDGHGRPRPAPSTTRRAFPPNVRNALCVVVAR